jgi:hypothetical protein
MLPTQKGGVWPFGSSNSYSDYSTGNIQYSGVLQYVYYVFILIIILLLLLILVNYTITPIFKLNPGDKGIISLPGSDDSRLYWDTPENIVVLNANDIPLGTNTQNWSFMLDIHLDNPTANTGKPRILFTRGGEFTNPTTYSTSDTILTINPNFNVCVYLDSLVNDLYVSVQTVDKTETTKIQTITIPNIPVGKSIRIGVFIGSKVLEVYTNGYLLSNKATSNILKNVSGSIYPPKAQILETTAQVSNLRIWNRPVSPAEFRSYGSPPDKGFKQKIISDSCISTRP